MNQTILDLQKKKCVPCEGGVPKLTRSEAQSYLKHLKNWQLSSNADLIRSEYRMKDFESAIKFANRISEVAEKEGHHPDLHLTRYRNLAIEIYTHAIGGLSENDFILAAKIDKLPRELKT